MAPQPDDLIVRIPAPSNEERAFIQMEQKRHGVSVDGLFKFWMQEARKSPAAE